ncbi:iron transporter [Helicobacter felis]|uniref:iron transporter n=1 Tax=Helicobacter felis TaxID=214 RepID=UPI000CF02C3D|nr:iron transporter [Helicobacter felis]
MKAFFLGVVLVLMPLFTACMCFGVFATLEDYGCHTNVLEFISVLVLGALSFLPIREIYKYTGWSNACLTSAGVNGWVVLFCLMLT